MTLVTSVKRLIKANGFLHVHAAALRSKQPLSNVANLRRNALFSKVISNTLVSYDRLANTYDLAQRAERARLPGAFVECGVWRGGVGGLMGLIAQNSGSGRETHLFDSFEGLPSPSDQDGQRGTENGVSQTNGALQPIGMYVASLQDVSQFLFDKLALNRDKVVLHKGWFQHTLRQVRDRVKPIALLRIDADWYESVKVCLENLYDNVVEGGYVILDDYGTYPGCQKAFHEFASAIGLQVELHRIDNNGVWFQKPRTQLQSPSQ